jgi:hypothetical protein
MKTLRLAAALLLALLTLSCRAAPKTFLEAWTNAAAANDAETVYALLSKASRDKIVANIQRSQEKAKRDPALKVMLTSMGKSLAGKDGATADPEAIAIGLLKHQLEKGYGGKRMAAVTLIDAKKTGEDTAEVSAEVPTVNGKTTHGTAQIRWEDKHWRAVVDVLGFQTGDGDAVSAWFVLPFYEGFELPSEGNPEKSALSVTREMRLKNGGDVSRLTPAERDKAILDGILVPSDGPPVSHDVHVKWEKRSTDEIRTEYLRASAKITAVQFDEGGARRAGYQTHLAALMSHFTDFIGESYPNVPFRGLLDASFSVDRAGAVTPKVSGFSSLELKVLSKELPRLIFGPLQGAQPG